MLVNSIGGIDSSTFRLQVVMSSSPPPRFFFFDVLSPSPALVFRPKFALHAKLDSADDISTTAFCAVLAYMACCLSGPYAFSLKISSKNRVVKTFNRRNLNVKQKSARKNVYKNRNFMPIQNDAFYLSQFDCHLRTKAWIQCFNSPCFYFSN